MFATIVALAVTAALAPPVPSQVSRRLVAGPVLAGERIVWGENVGGENLLRSAPSGRPFWRSSSSTLTGPLAASPSLVAFRRSFEGCPQQPGVVCPIESDVLAGPIGGSLRAIAPRERCHGAQSLDADGSRVVSIESDCDRNSARVVVRDRRNGWRASFSRTACCAAALAGRFVAWTATDAVAVYDLGARRDAYVAKPPQGYSLLSFDLQADGAIVATYAHGRTAEPSRVAWFSRREPRAHLLPLAGEALRIAGGRIVLRRSIGEDATELVLVDLAGRARRLARFETPIRPRGGVDFDGGRVTWASDRVDARTVDCPPPGVGRPCLVRVTGVTTIWRLSVPRGRPAAVARLPFVNAVP